jgi:hypothetical protein
MLAGAVAISIVISPLSSAITGVAPPLYATGVISIPARSRNRSSVMWVTVPMPECPPVMPGFFFAIATSAFTERAGTDGCETSTSGERLIGATAAKSRNGSYGSFRYSEELIVCVCKSVKKRVWPSGAALATISAAIVVPAPGRFSTITCWPRLFVISAAVVRANVSVAPPGANGTSMRIGLFGKLCACAVALSRPAANKPALRANMDILFSSLERARIMPASLAA